jgi:hypothetical protein
MTEQEKSCFIHFGLKFNDTMRYIKVTKKKFFQFNYERS